MFYLEEQGGEAKAVGWISMSDMFLLCSVVLIAGAMLLSQSLDSAQALNKANEETIRIKETEYSQLTKDKSALEKHVEQQQITIHSLNTQIAAFEARIKIQKALTEKKAEEAERLKSELALATAELGRRVDKEAAAAALRAAVEANSALKAAFEKRNTDYDALSKEKTALAAKTAELEIKITGLERAAAAAETAAAAAKIEIAQLKAKLRAANSAIGDANRTIDRLNAQIHAPPVQAKLVVTVWCEEMPTGFDLILLVEDPSKKMCSQFSPSIFTEKGDEIGSLLQSADVKSEKSKFRRATFYSNNTVPSSGEECYTVYAMIKTPKADGKKITEFSPKLKVLYRIDLNGSPAMKDESFLFEKSGYCALYDAKEEFKDSKFKEIWPKKPEWVNKELLCRFTTFKNKHDALAILDALKPVPAPPGTPNPSPGEGYIPGTFKE